MKERSTNKNELIISYLFGDLGCIFAVGVALFPTHETPDQQGINRSLHLKAILLTLIAVGALSIRQLDQTYTATRLIRQCKCRTGNSTQPRIALLNGTF